jgi:hypothetical protein
VLNNQVCARCDARLKHPLLPWQIGKDYGTDPYRVIFVGKPHRGTPGAITTSGIIDGSKCAEEYFLEGSSAYWGYTREILRIVFGDANLGWEKIAFTNLIKCTSVEDGEDASDKTTETMARCCMLDLGVFGAELRYLKPKTLVFYTFDFFPESLRTLTIETGCKWSDITSSDHRVGRGKRIGWWERECSTSWQNPLRVLVVGHPQGKTKSEYTNLVANWIRGES